MVGTSGRDGVRRARLHEFASGARLFLGADVGLRFALLAASPLVEGGLALGVRFPTVSR